ncbi:Cell division control protein 48 homolog D-like protein [Drosera capensis]
MSGAGDSSDTKGTKKDFSTAILERKKALNRLVIAEARNDDNSVVWLHPDTMEKLQIFPGDIVMLKVTFGNPLLAHDKRQKDTICIALSDETCDEAKVRINKCPDVWKTCSHSSYG